MKDIIFSILDFLSYSIPTSSGKYIPEYEILNEKFIYTPVDKIQEKYELSYEMDIKNNTDKVIIAPLEFKFTSKFIVTNIQYEIPSSNQVHVKNTLKEIISKSDKENGILDICLYKIK